MRVSLRPGRHGADLSAAWFCVAVSVQQYKVTVGQRQPPGPSAFSVTVTFPEPLSVTSTSPPVLCSVSQASSSASCIFWTIPFASFSVLSTSSFSSLSLFFLNAFSYPSACASSCALISVSTCLIAASLAVSGLFFAAPPHVTLVMSVVSVKVADLIFLLFGSRLHLALKLPLVSPSFAPLFIALRPALTKSSAVSALTAIVLSPIPGSYSGRASYHD